MHKDLLSAVSAVIGYLPVLLGCCFASLAAWKLLKSPISKLSQYSKKSEAERNRGLVERLKSMIPSRGNGSKDEDKGHGDRGGHSGHTGHMSRGWSYLRAALFLLLLVIVIAATFAYPPKYPIETHHQVYVWSQVKGTDDTWWISSDDGLPFMRWKCCPDYPCDRVVWPGYVAATVRYEERGTCKSIRANGLGWFWETDADGNVKEIR